MAENVLGKREEVYWEKVPQKIKRQAVEKALCFVDSSIGDAISGPITGLSEGDGMKRKRELEEHQTHSINFNIHADSVYPSGCLVFIRNLHPETNKTALRNLFLHARVENGDPSGKKDADGIDYLDYTKGMDCVCIASSFFIVVSEPLTFFKKSATSACVRLCTPNNSYTTSPPTQSYKQPDWTLPDQDLRSQVLPRQTTVLKMILHLLHISSQLQQNKYLADVKRYIGRKSLRK